jgi:hypothetical protein
MDHNRQGCQIPACIIPEKANECCGLLRAGRGVLVKEEDEELFDLRFKTGSYF